MLSKPKYRICRRLGDGTFGKCQTAKYALSESKKVANIGKSRKRRRQLTPYGKQLLDKQRVRFSYGITERQLSNYVKKAREHSKGESPMNAVYSGLEARLDNAIFKIGFTNTRRFARQIVSHGHITVNGRRVNIPSYALSLGDIIGIREGSKNNVIFANLDEKITNAPAIPTWLKYNAPKKEATIVGLPLLSPLEAGLNFGTVVEYYSRA